MLIMGVSIAFLILALLAGAVSWAYASCRKDIRAIRAPTPAISGRDDGYGTVPGAQYTAKSIADARFIGFEAAAIWPSDISKT